MIFRLLIKFLHNLLHNNIFCILKIIIIKLFKTQ